MHFPVCTALQRPGSSSSVLRDTLTVSTSHVVSWSPGSSNTSILRTFSSLSHWRLRPASNWNRAMASKSLSLMLTTALVLLCFVSTFCPWSRSKLSLLVIEGNGSAILYTGDIRSEPWFVNSLTRNPFLIEYVTGLKTLDCIYLDTSNTNPVSFPTKAEGLKELLQKVAQYPPDTTFHFAAWTFGYEQVWMALSRALDSLVSMVVEIHYAMLINHRSMSTITNCDYTELFAVMQTKRAILLLMPFTKVRYSQAILVVIRLS